MERPPTDPGVGLRFRPVYEFVWAGVLLWAVLQAVHLVGQWFHHLTLPQKMYLRIRNGNITIA